ncbi:hypothetical protein GA516_07080 [Lactobacillus pentosus]|uniref:Lipoprotein n=1 Tax=Lactiplantibacillus pentosus TaxID=1589 RepID=A0AB37RI29_LACPE|nr:hypothetical protein [Lactiplantibacillus pentosus]BBM21278.1 lipoprotein [Lactiplantibacillus plantarum]MCT3293898.1 hypothetical protein [Lactiplantibacillus pentosus]MPQ19109.1 hypothetical protein [Lactiplantibacillus pentosus]RMW46942.1 hypothetical protein D6U19_07390 [Lactiplantibacillus pentosus]RMW47265.1 hypothetical protein D6U20_04955 [Lactiplantibacillus pentosus]
MDHAYRSSWPLIVMVLIGLITLSGCAKNTGGVTASSATTATNNSTTAVLTKADQQISQTKIAAARKTLASAANPNAAVKNLATGLKYYQEAEEALENNQLSLAKGYFETLSSYDGTTDASFIAARQKLVKQYQAVKQANGYYNAARDDLSVHDLATAKANIDKLDRVSASHPVIKELQKKALAMKQAIMNYEASQSTSSGSESSTVVSSSSSSSLSDSNSATSSTDSTSSSSSTATSSSDSSTSSSSSSTLTTSAIIKQFQDAAGVTFASDTEFNITKQTSDYYQITAVYAADESSSSASKTVTDTYRYYPDSGNVTKEDSASGTFE